MSTPDTAPPRSVEALREPGLGVPVRRFPDAGRTAAIIRDSLVKHAGGEPVDVRERAA
ncbi:hypothetical protein ACFU99_31475 [Streptomyces sp. NPDC057654]|uniref:hypothetical protein n=1 Tax=Streptomyces sp. NPDC057654 TaxID=3346196 RepID=UPI00369B641D